MNKISRKGFLKIAAAAAMSGVTAGALAACNAASSSTAASSGAAGSYTPGTYTGTAEGISSTVKVTMTFSDSAVTDVVVDTSGETASYGAAAAEELKNQLLNAGSDEIDGVSGSTITSDAVKKAAKSCFAQAKGEATVTSVQLPTGDETDWLGEEPDIDEAAITETVDTDIVIVGAGNGGMFAAAYAAAKGLNFRVIEQNGNVQDTRHWVGAVDGFGAQEQGIKMDRAKLLSEVSRYASGKCDQRVVKTWINESAEMIEFVRSIMEDKYGVKMIYTYGDEAKWPAENAEHNTDICTLRSSIPMIAPVVPPGTSCCFSTFRSWATMWTSRPVWPSWKRTAMAALPASSPRAPRMTTSSATTPTRACCWPAAASPATPT